MKLKKITSTVYSMDKKRLDEITKSDVDLICRFFALFIEIDQREKITEKYLNKENSPANECNK